MTVTELIAALQGYPPDAVVCVEHDYGYMLVTRVDPGAIIDSDTVQAPTVVIA